MTEKDAHDIAVAQLRRLSPEDLNTHGELLEAAGEALAWATRWDRFAQRAIERSKQAHERADSCLRAAYKLRAGTEVVE